VTSTPARLSGPKKYIDVSGATPTVVISTRGNSTLWMSIVVSTPGVMVKA